MCSRNILKQQHNYSEKEKVLKYCGYKNKALNLKVLLKTNLRFIWLGYNLSLLLWQL